METLVVVDYQHPEQYYGSSSRSRFTAGDGGSARFIRSSPSGDFREINCRTFQSGQGLLPTPLKTCTTPVTKRAFSQSPSLKTSSQSLDSHSVGSKNLKRGVKSNGIAIPISIKVDTDKEMNNFYDDFSYSELWAGPAYSNSPPPSSLPIPKFSLRPKRTVSLELPASGPGIDMLPVTAKSASASPTRERSPSPSSFFHSADSATKTLRRILNLDMTDE